MLATPPAYPVADPSGAARYWPSLGIAEVVNPLASWSHDKLARELKKAREKRDKASARRPDLPPGASRARVTTANAEWSTACEAYDRLATELRRRASEPLP